MTIRRLPQDFQVEELLTDTAQAAVRPTPGGCALYQLTKTGYTTPQAVGDLARQMKVRQADVAFVGLKDKHAVTSQYVTLRLGKPAAAPPTITGPSWQAQRLGWVAAPLVAQQVRGNRFVIVVRDLADEVARRMETYARRITLPSSGMPTPPPPGWRPGGGPGSASAVEEAPLLTSPQGGGIKPAHHISGTPSAGTAQRLLVVNYFGDQRFGSARHQEGFPGACLTRGDFAGALKLLIATPSRKDKKSIKAFRQTLARRWGDWRGALPQLPRCPERRAVEILAKDPDNFRGAFTALPYFTQQMAVYSYQSLLWNEIARTLVLQQWPGQSYTVTDAFGDMVFPMAAALTPPWQAQDLPVPGHRTQPADPWAGAALAVLAEHGLPDFAALNIPGVARPFFGQAPRQLFMEVNNFTLSPVQNDDLAPKRKQRTASFDLPRGGYATVVLRALGQ